MPAHEIQGERIAVVRSQVANIDPAATAEPGQADPGARRRNMPPQLPAVRILIVDDDKAICEYMQTLLERDGFQVKTLTDPTGVEEEVRNGGYHLIILDLMMPKLDGMVGLRRIRKLDTDIAVVILTVFQKIGRAEA